MAGDYYAVSRQLLSSDLWLSEPFTRGQAWIDLIGLARWKAGDAWIKGHRIALKRGQLCWSVVKLSKRWQWSRGKTARFLGELETAQQIAQRKSSLTTVISVVNYEKYQPNGTAVGAANGHQAGQQSGRRRGTKEEGEEREEGKNTPPPIYESLEEVT